MLFAALGLPCFRTPLADGVGEPVLAAPREISQIAGRNACYGGRPRPRLSTPERCLQMARGDRTATSPRRKWRFGPTFLEASRWRTRDALDRAMRCRMATLQGATRLEPSDKAGIPLGRGGGVGVLAMDPGARVGTRQPMIHPGPATPRMY